MQVLAFPGLKDREDAVAEGMIEVAGAEVPGVGTEVDSEGGTEVEGGIEGDSEVEIEVDSEVGIEAGSEVGTEVGSEAATEVGSEEREEGEFIVPWMADLAHR